MNPFTSGLTTYILSESSSITCTESALHMLQVCKADLEYPCTKQGNSKHNNFIALSVSIPQAHMNKNRLVFKFYTKKHTNSQNNLFI